MQGQPLLVSLEQPCFEITLAKTKAYARYQGISALYLRCYVITGAYLSSFKLCTFKINLLSLALKTLYSFAAGSVRLYLLRRTASHKKSPLCQKARGLHGIWYTHRAFRVADLYFSGKKLHSQGSWRTKPASS
jgi:hypothetical protein